MKMTDIDRRTKLMKVIREVWQEEDGIGVVEIILNLSDIDHDHCNFSKADC